MLDFLKNLPAGLMGIVQLAAGTVDTGDGAVTPGKDNKLQVFQVSEENDLTARVTSIINGVIAVLGFVCVVVMIVGGVNYMISAGDSSKVTKAKNTILYGLIGLVICVLAFAIVNFVIVNIIQGGA